MKIETKFNVGDRVSFNQKTYTVVAIEWNSVANVVYYEIEDAAGGCAVQESKLSLAPRYSIGDKV